MRSRVGRYKVSSLLATGGMGQVYVAHDTQLDRRVALKILTGDVCCDDERMARFFLEARATAKLSHPNIAHVYEAGEDDGVSFIAMEYVEGPTLRQRLAGGPVGMVEAIDVATQIAAALADAHDAGIIHRDIKPENILLRVDATVKVLDFGVAKLTEGFYEGQAAGSERTTMVQTNPNLVIGTVNYMSPEQARGFQVDTRTDIFSLGVVLYEMLTGAKPFVGPSSSDIVAAILGKEPTPLAQSVSGIPDALQWIITKALAKVPEERYQTAREMMLDLRHLKRRLDLSSAVDRAGDANNQPTPTLATVIKSGGFPTVTAARSTSSAEYLVREIKKHKRPVMFAAAVVILAMGGLGYGMYRLMRSQPLTTTVPAVSLLTNNGQATSASVSPDGKYMAYVMTDSRGQSLNLKDVVTLSETEIVAPSKDAAILDTRFSPDGRYVFYSKSEHEVSALYQVAMLGGVPKKILDDISPAGITFSPDGEKLAFVRHDNANGEYRLMVVDKEGTNEQVLTARKDPDGLSYPSWSPDGRVIAFAADHFDTDGFHWTVEKVELEDRTVKAISPLKWWWVGGIAWLSDGTGLLMSAREIGMPVAPIWRIGYPGGEARRVTNDTNWYSGASVSANSGAAVVTRAEFVSDIWVAPAADPNRAVQITSGRKEGFSGLDWAPDGRIIFGVLGALRGETWSSEPDGSNKKQVAAVSPAHLSISRDGRYVVFESIKGGAFNLWRMDIDGSNLKQLTNGKVETNPSFSPDGQWVVYVSGTSDNGTIWKVSVDGGEPIQLTTKRSFAPAISPDGRFLAFCSRDEQRGAHWKIEIMQSATGEIVKTFDMPPAGIRFETLKWTPDGSSLAYVGGGGAAVANISIQPLNGGPPKQLTNFKPEQIWHFAWSRDRRQLAFSRGAIAEDVVLITDFK